jgi:selenocysteine-specific elongation factor
VGVVDVPGHEKFVRHMVAGATGVDMVALVVAGDEGIMPQTREHMEICQLLGVRYGLVVLTKVDMVDEEWLDLVEEDVREFTKGTFLEQAEIVHFSAITGQGRDSVIQSLARSADRVEDRQHGGLFRMPLDRVFSMKGFGTVVTGTSISGKVSLGDPVSIYPGGHTSKVRGLQVHNQSVEEAGAGLRTAINLQGLEREAIRRGQVLAPPDMLHPSRRQDLWVHHLSSAIRPLKNRTQVRFHVGTAEHIGRVLLLDREEMAPGEEGPAQIILEELAVCLSGDRFVLRSYSPIRTVAGGEVLNPNPVRHKRFHEATLKDLLALRDGDPVASIQVLIDSAGAKGVTHQDLAGLIDLPAKKIREALQQILTRRSAIAYDKEQGRVIGRTLYDALGAKVIEILDVYHREYPVRPGLGKEEFKTRVPGLEETKLLTFLLDRLQEAGSLVLDRDMVRRPNHKPQLADEMKTIERLLLEAYRQGGENPPYFKELTPNLPGDAAAHKEILEHLLKTGALVKVKADLYFDASALDRLWTVARDFMRQNGELTTPAFKELTGLSRKYLIPLLEHFDSRGLTMRVGDKRLLRTEKG